MLAPKVNKKKNVINILVIVIVLLIMFVVIYQNFIAGKKSVNVGLDKAVLGILDTEIKPINKITKEEFGLDVLSDEKLLNLVEFKYKRKSLSDLKVGKDDPFEVDKLLEIANRERR